jgi:N-acetylneuraminate synthase
VKAQSEPVVLIGDRKIGAGVPCFIIAEAGVNHNGRLDLALELVDAAHAAGADAVKFQTFIADEVVSPVAPKAPYQRAQRGAPESQLEMVRRLALPLHAFRALAERARHLGIMFLSSPFDEPSVDLLVALDVPAMKVGSGEITNLPLLAYVAQTGRPLLLSTGMSTLAEVADAVQTVRAAGRVALVLLHCVSNYPADPADANLRAMQTLADAFEVPVGFSDHTLGDEVALAAVGLGARVLEKHLTLDRGLEGPDHQASLDPCAFAELVGRVRTVESALGHGRKEPARSEADTARVARRSLVAARDIPTGATLTADLIAIRRPGTGLPPKMRDALVGRRVRLDVPAGALLSLEMLG